MNKILVSTVCTTLLYFMLFGCNKSSKADSIDQETTEKAINSTGDIQTPKGFIRVTCDTNEIGYYLRHLSFNKDNTVYLYNGETKTNQDAQYAVLNIDVGKRDLQQCADATMRLRAEYLFKEELFDQIKFRFTSGDLASWEKYSNGYRAQITGNKVTWIRTAAKDTSYTTFRKYLNLVFSYCGTMSMSKEVEQISIKDVKPGDVFHQTGNPFGHAITVMDVARDSNGRTAVIVSQSYMPAQSIHILKNPSNTTLSPWYILEEGASLKTPEWIFPPKSLKRWK